MKYLVVIEVIFYLVSTCYSKSYKDHSLVHVTPNNIPVLEFLQNLDKFYNATFWRRPSFVMKPVEFSISRVHLAELTRDTKDMNIDFFTVIRDLQSAFDNQTIKPYVRRRMETFDWTSYHSLEDIYDWLKDLSVTYPRLVQLQTIGKTVQERNILAVMVTLPTLDGLEIRSKVFVEGGCHAREWISPAFVTYLINTIVNAVNSSDDELGRIAYLYEWVFVPVLNPDGYVYSQNQDRLWRKNLRGGYGVDLNRNFGISFGKTGATKDNKFDDAYCGESAFSEKESSALASFAKDNIRNVKYYLSFHSYGQHIIIPYAFTKEYLDNFQEVKEMADKAAERSAKHFGMSWSTGSAYDTVGYRASGISTDWVKKSINVSYAVTIEMPDQGEYGFALPPNRILPTCRATMAMILPFLTPEPGKDTKLRMVPKRASQRTRGFESFLVSCFCFVLLVVFRIVQIN